MVTLENKEYVFNYRVVALAVRPSDGHVLMHRTTRYPLWYPPGGRCEMNEASPDAIKREMEEELGFEVQVGRLLYVTEIFYFDEALQKQCHELALYFSVAFVDQSVYEHTGDFTGYEANMPSDMPLIFRWVAPPTPEDPDADRDGFPLFPLFLRSALSGGEPETTRHIVQREPLWHPEKATP